MEISISLKEFKQMIKKLGYRVKTKTSNVANIRFLEVINQSGAFICGSGANCYSSKTIEDHKKVFDLLKEYKNLVYDYDTIDCANRPFKVVF